MAVDSSPSARIDKASESCTAKAAQSFWALNSTSQITSEVGGISTSREARKMAWGAMRMVE
jgi:hypothetical protein